MTTMPALSDRDLAIAQLVLDCKRRDVAAKERLGQHDLECAHCRGEEECAAHRRLQWISLRAAERLWKAEHGEVY